MLSWLWGLFTHRHEYGEEFWLAGHLVRQCEQPGCASVIFVVASMKEDRWRYGIDRSVDEPLDELEPLV